MITDKLIKQIEKAQTIVNEVSEEAKTINLPKGDC